jgi:aspartate beta-hydroxylase
MNLHALVDFAQRAAAAGRMAEAEGAWQKVLALDPKHPHALSSLGAHAYHRGQWSAAQQYLQSALHLAPPQPMVWLMLAACFREQRQLDNEFAAIERALTVDPYCYPALLAKGAFLERRDRRRLAYPVYRNALRVAPPKQQWPREFAAQLAHAERTVADVGAELSAFFQQRIAGNLAALHDFERARWQEAGALLAGVSKPYFAEALRLHVPRLPALPFHEREQFAWVKQLEAATPTIQAELNSLLAAQSDFRPYIAFPADAPVNQWQELNHSKRWSSYFLWENGAPVASHQAQCPQTTKALAGVELADLDGLCPNVMFSALAPRTAIPPHHGETNARLVVHLPLLVPPNCSYRVGHDWRQWEVGKCLIFDDSIEHEARNDSDQLRVVLIFDVWNPLLSLAEREVVRELSRAANDFERGNT